LALLVSFYDVTVENVTSARRIRNSAAAVTLTGPSGKAITDFDKITTIKHSRLARRRLG
jgi:hypothetical protein